MTAPAATALTSENETSTPIEMRVMLERLGEEIVIASDKVREVENSFFASGQLDISHGQMPLQTMDLIIQLLNNIAEVMRTLSEAPSASGTLDPAYHLQSVTLAEMADRLRGVTTEAGNEQSGDVDFF